MPARTAWTLAALQAAALWTMTWVPGARALPWLLALWTLAFAAYALAARALAGRAPDCGPPPDGPGDVRRGIWACGIVMRLGALPAAPALSEDVYRYMWDGWVQRHGVNPYLHAPADAALEGLRTAWWPLINHPEVPTIYPPGAQAVFALLALAGPSWWLFKLAWVGADLCAARLIDRLSRDRGPLPLLLYLWSPLLVVEVAWSGHLEPLGLWPMLGAVALSTRPGAWRAGMALGAGAAVKFAPLAGLPALARARGRWAVTATLGASALLFLPYLGAGDALLDGLRVYADRWEFNAGLHNVLQRLPGHPDLPKWIGAAAVGGIALRSWARAWPLELALLWTVGCALLLSPTVHPWYALWILPFASLRRSRAWLLLTGTVFLSYMGREAYLATGAWPEPWWLGWAVHGPPLALLAWDGWRGRRAQRLGGRQRVARGEEGGEGERARDPGERDVDEGA